MLGLNFSDYKCAMDKFMKGHTDALNCEYRPYFAANVILELH